MKLHVKKYYEFAFIQLEEGNTKLDLGTLDIKDLKKLQQEIKDMQEEVDWVVNALDRN